MLLREDHDQKDNVTSLCLLLIVLLLRALRTPLRPGVCTVGSHKVRDTACSIAQLFITPNTFNYRTAVVRTSFSSSQISCDDDRHSPCFLPYNTQIMTALFFLCGLCRSQEPPCFRLGLGNFYGFHSLKLPNECTIMAVVHSPSPCSTRL